MWGHVDGRVHGFVGRVCLHDKDGDGAHQDVAAGDSGVCHDVDEQGEDGEDSGAGGRVDNDLVNSTQRRARR